MHTLLIFFSLALGLAGCLLCAGLLRFARSANSRRLIQVAGLSLPTIILSLLTVLMGHFLYEVCFLTAAPVDVVISETLMLIGATGIVVVVLLNGSRALLLPMHLRHNTWEAPAWLVGRVRELASATFLLHPPSVLVAMDVRPWALVAGVLRPSLVVSSGLVALLDDEELSAVLCHELLHIKRADLWWTAVGGVLRDLTWFLPQTRSLYDMLLAEQELACDDRVVGEPRRLALASALARVWQAGLGSAPTSRGALALVSPEQASHFEMRVRRLLDRPGVAGVSTPHRAILAVTLVLAIIVPAQLALSASTMDAMGCNLHQFFLVMIH